MAGTRCCSVREVRISADCSIRWRSARDWPRAVWGRSPSAEWRYSENPEGVLLALFITFEGGEGWGKSTQARVLYRRLAESGISVMLTRGPGGTPLGEQTRRQLKRARDLPISPLAELLLVGA